MSNTINPRKERILVVDDEQDIRALLRILLEKEGWQVVEAPNGKEALAYVAEHGDSLSLVVMDIMMPVMDGLAAAAQIRDMTQVPILFLTARSSDNDKITAYRNGGDDYIVKPFHAIDLRLKISAMISRYHMYRNQATTPEQPSHIYTIGEGVEVNLEEKVVTRDGQRVVLTDREFEMLKYFCKHQQKTITPAELYEAVWGEPYLNTASNTVIVHIANLRKKLEQGEAGSVFIRTVWGKGYRLE